MRVAFGVLGVAFFLAGSMAADASCLVDLSAFESVGVGEVGESDTVPRLIANQEAKQINLTRDCFNEIDTCAVPTYYRGTVDPELLYVEVATSETVFARFLFREDRMVCTERLGRDR